MATRRFKVILNPVAGKGKAGERAPEIESLLKAQGIEHEIFITRAVWHAAELARSAGKEGFDIVVAAGGDGTVNEVINGLVQAAQAGDRVPTLGVLSVGRGNDFSYGADIPADLEACVAVLRSGSPRPLDVGRVMGGFYPQGRYFGNGMGAGFDTIVGLEAAKMRHVHGSAAYIFGAIKTFIKFPDAPEVVMTLDGQASSAISQKSTMISLMNGKRLGGTFFMAPRARNHDGLLDLCMTAGLSRGQVVGLVSRYVKGSQEGHPLITTGKAAHFRLEAPGGGLVVHADGETICTDGSLLDITCLPSCLSILHDPLLCHRLEVQWAIGG